LGSISQVRFLNSLLKRALEIGEKCCKRVLEGEGGGVIILGSEIVITWRNCPMHCQRECQVRYSGENVGFHDHYYGC